MTIWKLAKSLGTFLLVGGALIVGYLCVFWRGVRLAGKETGAFCDVRSAIRFANKRVATVGFVLVHELVKKIDDDFREKPRRREYAAAFERVYDAELAVSAVLRTWESGAAPPTGLRTRFNDLVLSVGALNTFSRPRSNIPVAAPRVGEYLLSLCLPRKDREVVAGDLEEEFASKAESRGTFVARVWYWSQVVRSIGPVVARRLIDR
jgi:hypothetical protein